MMVRIEFESDSVATTVRELRRLADAWAADPSDEAQPIFLRDKHVGWADCNFEYPSPVPPQFDEASHPDPEVAE